VGLVDHQQADGRGEQRQHVVAEARVVQPLGADEQQVDRSRGQRLAHVVPLVAVRAVDRVGAQPQARGGRELVSHEREQRADDERGPGAGLAQQRRGDEVHRRLAPARALHAQDARTVGHEVADRLELVGTELRCRVAGQRAQAVAGRGGEGVMGDGGGHGSMVASAQAAASEGSGRWSECPMTRGIVAVIMHRSRRLRSADRAVCDMPDTSPLQRCTPAPTWTRSP